MQVVSIDKVKGDEPNWLYVKYVFVFFTFVFENVHSFTIKK